jgi:hypothetical protein
MAGDCGTSLGTARSKFGMGWVTLVVFGIGVAWGCSCGPQRPICELFGDARTVFRGTVVDYHDGADGTLAAYLVRVEEPFKGLAAGQAEVFVDSGFLLPCRATYQVGKAYLFISHGPGNLMMASVRPTRYPAKWRGRERVPILMSGMCEGTLAAAEAGADLAWLRGEKKTRVYGRVVQTEPSWRLRDEATPLAGARVTLRDGATERAVNSGEDGGFSFDGIRPGEYTLTASRYGWWPVVANGVEVAAGGCAYRALYSRTAGEMTGVVLRHDGVPARGVAVELLRLGANAHTLSARTDDAGRFALEGVPVGEFVLGVNLRNPMTAGAPWPARYFPGVDSEAGARVFRTRPNEGIHGLQFILPPPLPVRTVRARAVWADGTAADGVGISAEPVGVASGYDVGSWVPRGNELTLRLMQGYSYRLRANTAEPRSVQSDAVVVSAGPGDRTVTLRLNGRRRQ